MEACKDELSSDSLRESLSQLNDKWSTLCQTLDNTTDRSKKGMSLTDKYIAMERAFDSWLSETEAKLDRPVSVTGSPTEMQQIVRKLEVSNHSSTHNCTVTCLPLSEHTIRYR